MRARFQEKRWRDVKCGEILLIEDGEHLPTDMVFLLSSAPNGECFVQTSSLDGERALKHKQCLAPIIKTIEKHGLNEFKCTINCEAPSKNLYEYSGFLQSELLPEQGTVTLSS